jgi:hypothetical protein
VPATQGWPGRRDRLAGSRPVAGTICEQPSQFSFGLTLQDDFEARRDALSRSPSHLRPGAATRQLIPGTFRVRVKSYPSRGAVRYG